MPAIFHVDQAATFSMVMFLSSAPKMQFGTQQQDTAKDGTPKWEVQVVASFTQFGRTENEILKVGVLSHTDPAKPLNGMPQPVELAGFRVGVTPAEKRTDRNGNEKIMGGTAWYQADEIRPLSGVPTSRKAAASQEG
ncbi:hypothetical protein [Streptomyces sp. YIM 132580]|uniref:hypothetical protein n=1 Tax=Streptomyces sp. YIM 132580 TaxID=2691958 RepID=UPI0013706601|nr:hypothetical protein [Streptomyces sp. YIM 132580]MXG30501.1 hypothetical protein [Streptomyces sp. YIM 132580]